MTPVLEQMSGYSALVRPELPGLNLSSRRVFLWQDEDNEGIWTVECPGLPGCISQGDTPEEALENIKDAMQLWLETALEMGDFIPAAR